MTDKTKVFPVEAAGEKGMKKKEELNNKSTRIADEEKAKVNRMVELESVAHFNEAMKTLTTRYFAASLESVETFGTQIQRANKLAFRLHDIFTSVITTSRERLEQNPFGFEQNKKELQGKIEELSAKLNSEEELTKSQVKQILELKKAEARLEKLTQTQKTSIEKLNATIETLHSDKEKLAADKEELHLKVEAATKENQESLQKIADLQNQLHAAQQELQKIGDLEQQLSLAVETYTNEIIQISEQKDLEKQSEILELQQKLLTEHQEELSKEVKKREEMNDTVLELNRIIEKQTVDAAKVKNKHEKEIEKLNKKALEAQNGYEAQFAKLKKEITSLKQ
jgi:chromosome segregation protein